MAKSSDGALPPPATEPLSLLPPPASSALLPGPESAPLPAFAPLLPTSPALASPPPAASDPTPAAAPASPGVRPGWTLVALLAGAAMAALLVGSVALLAFERSSRAVTAAVRALPQVPAALGFGAPRHYLLAVLNPAELRASGGAPLSVALVQVSSGKISVQEQGQTSTEIIPGNPQVQWEHVTQKPFPSASMPSRFVNATEHPDFRLAGEELMRAWVASGKPEVDGVIAIDTNAIIEALRETGPVTTTLLGEVTAENFKDKWIASYRELSSTGERQTANDEIAAALIERARQPSGLLGIGRALIAAVPGRHVQARLEDTWLQQVVQASGVAGEVSTTTESDHAAWYSVNNNASKTDVFSRRVLSVKATMTADGGARVVQTMTVTNAVPDTVFGDGLRMGYTTVWNASRWSAYLPAAAIKPTMAVPDTWREPTQWTDGLGRSFMMTNGWLPRGQSARMTMTYTLPAGTFPDGVYRLTVDPQPTLNPAVLTVIVTHPDGRREIPLSAVPLDRVYDVETGP